jgi:hypothetical protein
MKANRFLFTVLFLLSAAVFRLPAQQNEADRKVLAEIRAGADKGDAKAQYELGRRPGVKYHCITAVACSGETKKVISVLPALIASCIMAIIMLLSAETTALPALTNGSMELTKDIDFFFLLRAYLSFLFSTLRVLKKSRQPVKTIRRKGESPIRVRETP